MKRLTIIAVIVIAVISIPYWVMRPTIKRINIHQQTKTECMKYQMQYSALSPTKTYDQENYLQESYEIYRGLCDILMRIKSDDESVYLQESIRYSLDEIFQDQVASIKSLDDILLQSKYIKDILSKEMELLHQVGDQYEEMAMDELSRMNI
jgi:hypothetical protein